MPTTKISAVIITLNEEQHIARCLQSVLQVADEVIVMDSHSTDRTSEICKSFNIKFISTDWKGFSATKNEGNEFATHQYILSLDADECLDGELITEIKHLKEQGLEAVYSVNRLTNYCGKWIRFSGWSPDWKVRLFPKNLVKWNDAIVHEELELPQHIEVVALKGRLLHYSYSTTSQHRQRADKYSILTAKKYASQGRKTTIVSPYVAAIGRFFSMYFIKMGFLDGKEGFQIAWISAKSNALKYKELQRLTTKKNG
ncbi:MAG: glycosyltransferase family 2 protein [Bacteroidetes bacterium]|nr:glycosyltransferase family 2 protein [Bacteroidota bacterium]MBM3419275.1 glycosyltransferase family 2 protein [Bacteroidota bacterium]